MSEMKVPEEIEILLADLDENNISSLLTKHREVVSVRKQLGDLEAMIKVRIRSYLKERKWKRYKDDTTGMSVNVSTKKTETVDKKQLKAMITDAQYQQVLKISTSEVVTILTKDAKERLKNYVRK